MKLYRIVTLLSVLLLPACATKPIFQTTGVNNAVTPNNAVTEIEKYRNEKVMWGGVLVTSQNLEKTTVLEILAYPLDSEYRPETDKKAYRRFIAVYGGYLETADFAPGRLVTILGELVEIKKGRIGEMEYDYPRVSTMEVHLWPKPGEAEAEGRFHFGIGISIIKTN